MQELFFVSADEAVNRIRHLYPDSGAFELFCPQYYNFIN